MSKIRARTETSLLVMDNYRLAKDLLHDGNLEESFKLLTAFIDSQKDVGPGDDKLVADALNTRGHIR